MHIAMVTDFIERVRAALKRPGVTARGLAQKAGLHRNTLCNIDRPDWNPTAAVLKALEAHIEAIERGEWSEDAGGEVQASATNSGENIGAPREVGHGPFSEAISSTCSPTSEHPLLPLDSPSCSTGPEAEAA